MKNPATLACSFLAKRITVVKLYHFDGDRYGRFRRMGSSSLARGSTGSMSRRTGETATQRNSSDGSHYC